MGDIRDAVVAAQQIAQAVRGFGQIWIPHTSCLIASSGAPLVVFSNGVADGVQITNSKTWTYRWNNDATPPAIATTVALPQDLDPAYDIEFHALVSKSGATVGDAMTFTVAAYTIAPPSLHDADSNFGGATNAVVGDATAKTVTELTRALATANLIAPPAFLALSFGPTAGTLGTDDALVHAVWLEYTKKLVA